MMENKIKKSLTNAYSELTPDLLDRINNAPAQECRVYEEETDNKPKFKYSFLAPGFIFALAVFACVISFSMRILPDKQYAYIYIDVNPSIEIEINKDGTVHSCRAYNNDGADIVVDSEFIKKSKKNNDLEITIEAVIDALKHKGYLETDKDSVLISCAKAEVVGKRYLNEVVEKVSKYVKQEKICKDVIYREVNNYDHAKAKAHEYGISPGKANYIEEVVKVANQDERELASKNINGIVAIKNEKVNRKVEPVTTIKQQEATTSIEITTVEVTTTKKQIPVETTTIAPTTKVPETTTHAPKKEEATTAAVIDSNKKEEATTVPLVKKSKPVKIKKIEVGKNGKIKVIFKKKVSWSDTVAISVSDSLETDKEVIFLSKKIRSCVIKISDIADGGVFTVRIEGIKNKNSISFNTLTFKVKIKKTRKVKAKNMHPKPKSELTTEAPNTVMD